MYVACGSITLFQWVIDHAVFVILLSIFALIPAPIPARSLSLPLPLTPSHSLSLPFTPADERISTGE